MGKLQGSPRHGDAQTRRAYLLRRPRVRVAYRRRARTLFVTGLGPKYLSRLSLDGDKVVGEERLLTEVGERLRDVVVGPDGARYVATANDRGRVIRVAPKR